MGLSVGCKPLERNTMKGSTVQQLDTQSGSSYQGGPPDTLVKRIFLSPAVTILLLFSIFPLFWSLGMSFTDHQRGGSTSARDAEAAGEEYSGFLGMDFEITGRNYARIVEDERLHATARNTLFYVFGGVTIQYIIGFGLAVVLNQRFLGRGLVRVIFLMPQREWHPPGRFHLGSPAEIDLHISQLLHD